MAQRDTLTTAEKAFVEKLRVARLGTTDENGTPYLVPVCYAFDGTYFYTPLDEKPKRVPGTKLRRVRNIEARHEAALLVDQYADDWSQLGYVLIHGRADLITPTDERHRQAVALLRERYVQYKSMALEQSPLIMITPQRITAWGQQYSSKGVFLSMNNPISSQTLQEMQTYYRERAREYDEWFYRQGRYNYSPETNALWFAEVDEVFAALQAFHLTGNVLELAAGTGIWTERLVRTASTVTAIDASPEMIEINRARVSSEHISYLQADLFHWQPEQTYDAVFFGFWISHVPLERLDGFLRSVAAMLHSGGKVFFVDTRREPTSTAANHQMPIQDSQTMTRILNDGRSFEIVKNFYDPADLVARCTNAGFDITIRETTAYFLYGYGTRR